jgi:fructose-bisphosphate aldolase class II
MLTHTLHLLTRAQRDGYGVLACNVIGLDHAEAIVQGAEAERAPVILQVSQNAIRYRLGRLEPLVTACRELALAAAVPVALHLDHATTREICERAVAAGMSSVMFDASSDDDAVNIARTGETARWAHDRRIAIEGEIGVVGGKGGPVTTVEEMTDPDAAARYVAATGVDLLAIAVGTEHGMARKTRIDLERIAAIRAAVAVPLVLHGSSGVPDADLREAVRLGIAKVNMATQLNAAFTAAIRDHLVADPHVTDPRRYGAPAREAMAAVVQDKCRLVGASGRA